MQMTRLRGIVLSTAALVVLACSAAERMFAPGQVLVGTWSTNPDVVHHGLSVVVATDTGTRMQGRCLWVRTGPIRLDDTLGFQVVGTVTESGPWPPPQVGDAWPISGKVIGSRIVLNGDTLTNDAKSPGVPVCNQ